MKFTITATALPPPHLARHGAVPERLTKTVTAPEVGAAIAEFFRAADGSGVFAAGGCINVVIQRASDRPTPGPGPQG